MNICQIEASQLCDFLSHGLEGGENSRSSLLVKLDSQRLNKHLQLVHRILPIISYRPRLPPPSGRSGGGPRSICATPSGAGSEGLPRFGIPAMKGMSCARAMRSTRRSSEI